MLTEAMDLVDKSTGLTELLYGQSGASFRSATEAEVKNANSSIRPEDMADKTEAWLGVVAQKEMLAAYYSASPEDFKPILGESGAMAIEEYVLKKSPDEFCRGWKYNIAAGSARRMNMAARQTSLERLGQIIMPFLQMDYQAGNVERVNAYLEEYGRTLQIPVEEFRFDPPMQQQQGPSPEELAMQQHEQKMAMQQQMHQQKMEMQAASHEQKALFDREDFVRQQDRSDAQQGVDIERELQKMAVAQAGPQGAQ